MYSLIARISIDVCTALLGMAFLAVAFTLLKFNMRYGSGAHLEDGSVFLLATAGFSLIAISAVDISRINKSPKK